MRCTNCNKPIDANDRFCRHCGEKVVMPAPLPEKSYTPGRVMIPIEMSDFGPAEILAPFESQSSAAWGAHIYTGPTQNSSDVKTLPEGCPEWVAQGDWFRWFRRGVSVWDHATQRIGAIRSGEAVTMLEKALASDEWKSQGIPIVERREDWIPLPEPEPRRRKSSRKKKGVSPEPEPPPEEPKPKAKFLEEERLRLTGQAAEEFIAYLQTNEAQLRKMADEEEKLQSLATRRFIEVVISTKNQSDLEKLDGSGRKLVWTRQNYPSGLVCDVPPDRATILLIDNGMRWQPVIERPNHMKVDYERFWFLEEALDWVEQKLPELRAQDDAQAKEWEREEAEERAKIAALPTMDLTPYWIDPSALEPERVTYRVIIDLEYEPYSFEKMELSFGQYWRSDEEFYTPTMILKELRLVSGQVEVKQLSQHLGLYSVRSTVTYYEAQLAAAQAQQLWDRSAVGERFAQEKVSRARYGYEEVETKYQVWLGGLERPDKPWPAPTTRAEYLARRAKRETLLYALDINGYRQFIDIFYKFESDDELLVSMHQARTKSRYLPDKVRAESQRWLKTHNHES